MLKFVPKYKINSQNIAKNYSNNAQHGKFLPNLVTLDSMFLFFHHRCISLRLR